MLNNTIRFLLFTVTLLFFGLPFGTFHAIRTDGLAALPRLPKFYLWLIHRTWITWFYPLDQLKNTPSSH